jgi:GTP cyclohydrolase I
MALNTENIQKLVRELLIEIGEDPHREGLVDTPKRIASALAFLTSGYRADIQKLINEACFAQETTSMVIVGHWVYSLCSTTCSPSSAAAISATSLGKVFGISKLARLVDMYARSSRYRND